MSLCGNFLSNFSSAKSGAARDLPLIVLVGFFNSVSCFLKTFFLDFVLKQKEVCCCGLESIWNFIFDLQKWFWILFSPIYFLRKNKICITLLMKCIPTLTWGYSFFSSSLAKYLLLVAQQFDNRWVGKKRLPICTCAHIGINIIDRKTNDFFWPQIDLS